VLAPDADAVGQTVILSPDESAHVGRVLRLGAGAEVRVFNGRDGEWQATLLEESRRSFRLDMVKLIRSQPPPADLHYLFVPIRQARLDYMVEKAVEMGVTRLRPVLSQHGQVSRLNTDRMEAHAIEAAEQCGVLAIPEVDAARPLAAVIDDWSKEDAGRRIVFCDEQHGGSDPLAVLAGVQPAPLALLVGPEGGFSDEERRVLREQSFVTALPLGPRILRADTAGVAALALIQAVLGDWRGSVRNVGEPVEKEDMIS